MWQPQREFWHLDNYIKVLVGGFGAGKTNLLGKRSISDALANAPVPVAAVSPTYGMARATTIQTISELLHGKQTLLGSRVLRWKYNKSTHEFRIMYRGRPAYIVIYSGDNPDSLRGYNLAAAHIDEPFIQDRLVFDFINARIRHPEARHKELCLYGTPEQLNWGYDLCEGELADQHDVAFVRAPTRSNRALDDGYVERLGASFSGKAAEAYLEGMFSNLASGLVYYAFSKLDNVVTVPTPPPGARLGVGMDFNVNPMAATVFWWQGKRMHFYRELELPNADTEYMAMTLKELPESQHLRQVFPDASGKNRATNAPGGQSDFTILKRHGFHINAPSRNPPVKDRFNAANGLLRSRDDQVHITVDPGCKKLIKYLSTYSHELMNKQKEMSHLLDAFSYPCAYLHPVRGTSGGAHQLKGI